MLCNNKNIMIEDILVKDITYDLFNKVCEKYKDTTSYFSKHPNQYQIQKWLRDVYGIIVEIYSTIQVNKSWQYQRMFSFKIVFSCSSKIKNYEPYEKKNYYSNYEDALEDGIVLAIQKYLLV